MFQTVIKFSVVLVLLGSLFRSAQGGPMTELAEWMLKQGGRYAEDVAGKGARQVGRELEELAAKTGDDVVDAVIRKGGPGAWTVVREMGEHAPEAARLVAKHGPTGKLLVEQGRAVTIDAVRVYGDDAVRVLSRVGPADGARMLSVYGGPLAKHADVLKPESMAHLRHWLPDVDKAPTQWRSAFLDKLKAGGDDFVLWVDRRWKPLAVCGGLSIGGITAYRLGDGLVKALPDPARNPVGWLAWWLPAFIIVAILATGRVVTHWIRARRRRRTA